ncbi:DUF2480 family protein [Gangjinia marincola]|uniref:DUF2480 family protein n=1 Tax=Gangjinia marincola TaxID=578463 RepID=A0ABP3XTB0_9FLAO
MAEGEIINRVAQSKLVTVDLEDFYPVGKRIPIDISDWLYEGLILKEKEFRAKANTRDWQQYKDAYVALHCSTDAIIPTWAYILLSSHLHGIAKKTIVGDLVQLETILYTELIDSLDFSELLDQPVIIKGCAYKPVPQNAYLLLLQKLQPFAKSIMFGEACSAVPLYKKKRS